MKDAEISEKRAKLRASLASGKPLTRDDVDEQVRKDYVYDESSKDLSKQDALDLDDEVRFYACRGLRCGNRELVSGVKLTRDSILSFRA